MDTSKPVPLADPKIIDVLQVRVQGSDVGEIGIGIDERVIVLGIGNEEVGIFPEIPGREFMDAARIGVGGRRPGRVAAIKFRHGKRTQPRTEPIREDQ